MDARRAKSSGWLALAMVVTLVGATVAFAGVARADEPGQGTADCPVGTTFVMKFDEYGDEGEVGWADFEPGDQLGDTGVEFVAFIYKNDDDSEDIIGLTLKNTNSTSIVIAVKGGSDQVGNWVEIAAGATADVTVLAEAGQSGAPAGLSNLSVCAKDVGLGSITVDKVVAGTGASTTEAFSFTMTGTSGFSLASAATPMLFDDLPAGTYDVAEGALTAGQTTAGWAFTSVSCTGGGTVVAGQQATVTLSAGQDVTCTFINTFTAPTVLTPTLTLDKVVTTGASTTTEFGFTLGGQAVSTTLAAADAPLLVSSTAGAYVLAENALTGWNTSAIDCTGNAAAETINLTTRTVTVTVGADEDVVCTFTNTPQGGQVLPGNPTPTPAATVKPTPRGAVLPSTSLPVPGLDLALVGTVFVLAASGFGAASLIERRRR